MSSSVSSISSSPSRPLSTSTNIDPNTTPAAIVMKTSDINAPRPLSTSTIIEHNTAPGAIVMKTGDINANGSHSVSASPPIPHTSLSSLSAPVPSHPLPSTSLLPSVSSTSIIPPSLCSHICSYFPPYVAGLEPEAPGEFQYLLLYAMQLRLFQRDLGAVASQRHKRRRLSLPAVPSIQTPSVQRVGGLCGEEI